MSILIIMIPCCLYAAIAERPKKIRYPRKQDWKPGKQRRYGKMTTREKLKLMEELNSRNNARWSNHGEDQRKEA